MPSFRDLLKTTKSEISEIDTETAESRLGESTFLDVRELDEYEQGTIPGSTFLPRGHLESKIENQISDHAAPSNSTFAPSNFCWPSSPTSGKRMWRW